MLFVSSLQGTRQQESLWRDDRSIDDNIDLCRPSYEVSKDADLEDPSGKRRAISKKGGLSNIFLHKLAENIQDAYVELASRQYLGKDDQIVASDVDKSMPQPAIDGLHILRGAIGKA
ncbi:hypothetical protein Tco_1084796 [Tanacetum coccineum]